MSTTSRGPSGIWQGIIGGVLLFGSFFALPEGLSRLAKASLHPEAPLPQEAIWLAATGGPAMLIGILLLVWCIAIRRRIARLRVRRDEG